MRTLQPLIFGRVEDVDAAGDDRDGPGLQRSVMGGGVDAAGEAGDDDGAGFAEFLAQGRGRSGSPPPRRCARRRWLRSAGRARSDRPSRSAPAARIRLRRGAADSRARRGRDSGRRASPPARSRAATASRRARRGARPPPRAARSGIAASAAPAEPKRAISWRIGDRTDRLRPDQPQPVDPLLVERRVTPRRGRQPSSSVPANRRRIFSRCFQKTSRAKPRNSSARSSRPSTLAAIGAATTADRPPTEE